MVFDRFLKPLKQGDRISDEFCACAGKLDFTISRKNPEKFILQLLELLQDF